MSSEKIVFCAPWLIFLEFTLRATLVKKKILGGLLSYESPCKIDNSVFTNEK
jgi:hypothetical protein